MHAEIRPGADVTPSPYLNKQRLGAFVASVVLVFGAWYTRERIDAGDDASQEVATDTATTPPTFPEQLPPEPISVPTTSEPVPFQPECSTRTVIPGANFNPSEAGTIERQLEVLRKLHANAEVDSSDAATAIFIVHSSLKDPLYVQAMVSANDSIESGHNITADQFLELPVQQPELCDGSITKESSEDQLQDTLEIGLSLVGQFSEVYGDDEGLFTLRDLAELGEVVNDLRGQPG